MSTRREFLKITSFTFIATLILNLLSIFAGKDRNIEVAFVQFLKSINSDTPSIPYDSYRNLVEVIMNSGKTSADALYFQLSKANFRLSKPFYREEILKAAKLALDLNGSIANQISFIYEENADKLYDLKGQIININFVVGHFNGPELNEVVQILIADFDEKGKPQTCTELTVLKSSSNTVERKITAKTYSGLKDNLDNTGHEVYLAFSVGPAVIHPYEYSNSVDLSEDETKKLMEEILTKVTS